MGLDPQIYVVVAITVIYPALLIAGILFVRFISKDVYRGTGERRGQPRLRRVLNALIFVPMGVTVLLAGWSTWRFAQSSSVPFSPLFYAIGALTIIYPLILVGVVLAIRLKGKGSVGDATEKRNRHPTLRHVLDALAVVPIGVIIVLMMAAAFGLLKLS